MKLQLRKKSKRGQALDALASVAKTWSEWQLGKRVAKTAAKGTKKASSVKGATKRTPVKIAAAVALVGGIGAAAFKKLKGGQAEPIYSPPGPAPDTQAPPPAPVAVDDLAVAGSPLPETTAAEPGIAAAPEPLPAEPEAVIEPPVVSEPLPAEPGAVTEPPAVSEPLPAEPAIAPEPDVVIAPEPDVVIEPEPDAPADKPA